MKGGDGMGKVHEISKSNSKGFPDTVYFAQPLFIQRHVYFYCLEGPHSLTNSYFIFLLLRLPEGRLSSFIDLSRLRLFDVVEIGDWALSLPPRSLK